MKHKKLNTKVLFLASWYPSDVNHLLGNFVQKHAEIASDIVDVEVLFAVSNENVDNFIVKDTIINGVKTIIVYYPKIKSNIPLLSSYKKKSAYIKALSIGFEKLTKQNKYNLVHLNIAFPAGLFAFGLKSKHKIPYIITEHWTGFLPHKKEYEKLPIYIKRQFKKIYSNADKILSVSEHLGESLVNLKLTKNFETIPNVVNSEFFYPNHDELNNDKVRFIHVSTFNDEHKNISGMLSAFSQLDRNYELHIITEGSEDEVWKKLKAYNIPKENCLVDSKLTTKEVGEAMRLADCFILFSNYETFSVVLAEAWRTGIPAIYSQCGGLTEINNPDLGVQIEPRDEEGLLNALQNFQITDYSRGKIFEYSHNFSEEKLREQLLKIYSEVI
ncbi:MAG: glycosyltransferase [Brumimicrobium sp.]